MNDRPVTEILNALKNGDEGASAELLPLVYEELRKLAAQRLKHESAGQTLQATALVHEAYLRLVDVPSAQEWDSRGHFFSAAAEAMRRIMIEQARRKQSLKLGGDRARQELKDDIAVHSSTSDELLQINAALDELEVHDPQAATLVKLRFFAGFKHQEAADMLGISRRVADRLWITAKTWMFRHMSKS